MKKSSCRERKRRTRFAWYPQGAPGGTTGPAIGSTAPAIGSTACRKKTKNNRLRASQEVRYVQARKTVFIFMEAKTRGRRIEAGIYATFGNGKDLEEIGKSLDRPFHHRFFYMLVAPGEGLFKYRTWVYLFSMNRNAANYIAAPHHFKKHVL